jgi:flagellar hook-length control protein FliK
MFLLLNTTQGGPGNYLGPMAPGSGVFHAAAEDAVQAVTRNPGADFSKVLAGSMNDSTEDSRGTERSVSAESERVGSGETVQSDLNSRNTPSETVGQRTDMPGEAGSESKTGGGYYQWAWSDQALATTQSLMGGLDGLIPVLEQQGSVTGLNLDPAFPGGLPMELRSRLAAGIAAHYTNRNGLQTLTMKLNPEHLGQVDVQMQAKENHLSVRLQVSSRESETALRENIKELADAIQKQTGKFQTVDVRIDLKQGENLGRQFQEERSGNAPDDDAHGQSREENDGPPDRRDAQSTDTEPEAGIQGG